jgi:hypothetical protein
MSTPDMPAAGGSYVRKKNGKLERVEFTAPASTVDQAPEPPVEAAVENPAEPAPPTTSDT